MHKKIEKLKKELSKAIVGQENLIEGLLIGLLSEGHILVEGVPGLAKTSTINALSQALGIDSKRIQFTPDMLPSDIIGTEIYNPKDHSFSIKKGAVFTHLLLADEINRAPAKVQSALLEVMQEKQVSIAEQTFKLSPPFFVMATQNPIEQEGVYPLPQAQLDRFMMKILVSHNSHEEELEIMRRVATKAFQTIESVLNHQEIEALQEEIQNIHIDKELEKYIIQLIVATRDTQQEHIMFGASPRASIDLYKARAFLRGNSFVSPADIAQVMPSVLRHRIVLSYEARAKDISSEHIISQIIESIPIP
ncbi:MoxR-like ATPase in aerotolerance operon [hydrothermal vent metagenome]|uniref:MoxR-like ATPase in aerotolerance operon n=1 Tax=hydrothermal vent metagenome TaxID=652676 RepID=A0A1W1CYQ5_9ZZZZ